MSAQCARMIITAIAGHQAIGRQTMTGMTDPHTAQDDEGKGSTEWAERLGAQAAAEGQEAIAEARPENAEAARYGPDRPDDAEQLGAGGVSTAWMWHRQKNGLTVVTVTGEVDVYSAPPWRTRMRELIDQCRGDLILVARDVEFFDSTALGVIVGCLKALRAKQGTCIRIVDETGESFTKIFKFTGLTKVFPLHTSLDEALDQADYGSAA